VPVVRFIRRSSWRPTRLGPIWTFQMGLFVPYAGSVQAIKTNDLPARTNSDANTYASRADADAYARAIATTIVAGATVVAGASGVAG
jgi:hypothetical protein